MASVEHLFAKRIERLKPSAIRQIFALLKRPGIISFAGGWPDPALFPVAQIRTLLNNILDTEAADALQYGASGGDPRLLDYLRRRMHAQYGMTVGDGEMLIVSGSQQGIYLCCTLFLNRGDTIVVEAPTFVGAFGAMQTFEANIVGIGMDDEGLDTQALAQLLERQPVKAVYTIPEFQNPSGRTMSLARRQQLVALAAAHDFIIIEDAPYSDLRYEGEPMPPIYTLDDSDRTVYLGSFSKNFTPLRVGWLVAPAAIVQKMTFAKMAIDVNTPALTQALIYHFCEQGLLDEQIDRLRSAYKKKRDTMFAALDRGMPPAVDWTTPAGGMFIWLTLPQQVDATELFHAALDEHVAFVTGNAFYPPSVATPSNVLRLNFVTPDIDKIPIGIDRLSRLIAARL